MRKRTEKFIKEAGSVIWIVLIAVALFAALSAAVANMMRSGGTDVRGELRNVDATQILQFTDSLKKSVQSMVIDGVAVGKIDFDTPMLTGYANAACTSSQCKVFDVNGGGVSYEDPDEKWLDISHQTDPGYGHWGFPDDTCVQDYPGQDAADCSSDSVDNEEVVVTLPYVRKDTCMQINDKTGVTNPTGDAPDDTDCYTAGGKYSGTFTEGGVIAGTALHGQASGCFKQTTTCGAANAPYYVYYKVLVGR